jgi:hypothetical protein
MSAAPDSVLRDRDGSFFGFIPRARLFMVPVSP